MKIVKLRVLGALAATAVIASCGGGGDTSNDLLIGIITDSPVTGLNYATPSVSGVTDANGAFSYTEGEIVNFSIGNLALPEVVGSEVITPLDIAASDDITDPSVVNIARLLQSLDADSDPENGISIPGQLGAEFIESAVFDPSNSQSVDNIVASLFNKEREAVSAEQAMAHFASTLSAAAGSVGGLDELNYLVPDGEAFSGENVFVDEKIFGLTVDGEVHEGTASVSNGVYQLEGEEDHWFVSVNETDEGQLACFAKSPVAVADCDGNLYHVFKDEQRAMDFGGSVEGTIAVSTDNNDVDELAIGAANEESTEAEVSIDSAEAEVSIDSAEAEVPIDSTEAEVSIDSAADTESSEAGEVTEAITEIEETPQAEEVVDATPVEVIPAPARFTASDITDIIVLTGQTNAAGEETGFDPALDTGNDRLFAFNEDGQWRTADLDQYWDNNLPSNFASATDGREPYNNLAFQIGKSLSEQSDRVVGIIMITAPGEGISHWDFNSDFYRQIRNKVTTALAQLPQTSTVDALIWLQGETDWLLEGTADPGATGFASEDSDFYRNYYPNKLSQLISNLRSEFWYGQNAQFICGETKKADLNTHLIALNDDADALTSCATASDLPTLASDPFENSFSAAALRTLGGRIADLFIAADQQ